MSEDLSIKKQPSSMPYVLGGGLVGAAGGWAANEYIPAVKNYVTNASEYKSFEDLVAAAKDTAEFSSTIEKASEENKPLLEKLSQAVKDGEKAGTDWDNKFAEFVEKNKNAVESPELPADHQAVDAYNKKRESLIEEQINKIKSNATKPDNKAIEAIQPRVDKAVNELKSNNKVFNRLIDDMAVNLHAEIELGNSANIKTMEENQTKLLKEKVRKLTGAKENALFADDIAQIEKEISIIDTNIKKSSSRVERMILEDTKKELVNQIKANRVSPEAESLLIEAKNAVQNRVTVRTLESAKMPAYSFGKAKETATKALEEYANTLSDTNSGIRLSS